MMLQFSICVILFFSCFIVFGQEECSDMQPSSEYSCAQQKGWGKCEENWMVQNNWCARTCGRCEDDFACGLEGSCIYGVCDSTRCADGNCNAKQSNIQGEILILDYNSLSYNGGPNHPPAVTNPASCCDKCKETQGCNAWTFCSNRDGCGQGCQAYASSLAGGLQDAASGKKRNFIPVPILGFGEFGGCDGDRWPWLLCSLKRVEDVENPVVEAGETTEWVSGILTNLAACDEDLSFSVCSTCRETTDETFCKDCASAVSLNEQLYCPVCTDTVTPIGVQQHCIDCLASNGGSSDGCGKCATLFLPEDVQECFECTQGEDDIETQNGCYNCYNGKEQFLQPDCVRQCVKADETPLHAKPECGLCYNTYTNINKCVECLQNSAESPTSCRVCSTDDCFSCLSTFRNNRLGRSGCASCAYIGEFAAEDCYSCVEDDNVPDVSKVGCGACSRHAFTTEDRQPCYNCLATVQNEDQNYACSSCLLYADSREDTQICYDCVSVMNARGSAAGACSSCAQENTPEERNACYECVQDEGKPAQVAELCHMCFGSWVNDAGACVACMATATNAEEASNCYN
eukprot:TRINITY_DN4502_c0_g1_i12.p1 TRINITY_DN4502_c0_g1~~TRINITY_DN4502_c0_g1_i12.p1  ORF type:complete len:573 (-),score=54.31 TRINITY_DN4502_c0_g1_i12:645-2363(-)